MAGANHAVVSRHTAVMAAAFCHRSLTKCLIVILAWPCEPWASCCWCPTLVPGARYTVQHHRLTPTFGATHDTNTIYLMYIYLCIIYFDVYVLCIKYFTTLRKLCTVVCVCLLLTRRSVHTCVYTSVSTHTCIQAYRSGSCQGVSRELEPPRATWRSDSFLC